MNCSGADHEAFTEDMQRENYREFNMKDYKDSEAFPAEIFDLIMDDLGYQAEDEEYHDDPSTKALYSCALVSREFRLRACRYLKGLDIVIDSASDLDASLGRLLTALKSSVNFPGLGLVFYLDAISFTIEHQVFKCSSMGYLFQATFPDILDALHGPNHGISNFGLYAQVRAPSWFRLQDWTYIDQKFTKAFHALCCSPKMKTLHLERFSDVPRSILRGSHIENLNLSCVEFAVKENGTVQQKNTSKDDIYGVQLRSLGISTHCELPVLLSVLQEATKSTVVFASCVPLVFANLIDLTITIRSWNPDYQLSLMPQLQVLRLIDSRWYNSAPDEVALPFHDFFSRPGNLPLPYSLRRLTMEGKSSLGAFFLPFAPSVLWDFLDFTFSHESFSNVEDIRLQLRLGCNSEDIYGPRPNEEFLTKCGENILKYLPHVVQARPTMFILDIDVDSDELQLLRDSDDHIEHWQARSI